MPGPLLDEWPSLRKLELEYNDYYSEGTFREARYPAVEYVTSHPTVSLFLVTKSYTN